MTAYQTRETVPDNWKWKLEDIYATEAEWEEEYAYVEQHTPNLQSFKGQISSSAASLYNYLSLRLDISHKLERLAVYARMKEDENTKDSARQARVQKLDPLSLSVGAATTFFKGELLSLSKEHLLSFLNTEPKLLPFKKYLLEYYRFAPHILSEKEENLLSQTSLLTSASTTFNLLNNADLTFKPITDKEGETHPLTQSTYSSWVRHEDRNIRKQAFDHLYEAYEQHKHTFASTLHANVKQNHFYSKIRQYPDALSAELFDNNISKDVYTSLIQAVRDNLDPLHRYFSLRKRVLKVEELHLYDTYTALVPENKKTISYEEAYETMKKGLSVLGEEYVSLLEQAYHAGWIDVAETEGKRSGAYAWGPYGTHPFVLLNHKEDTDSMFTLAHEMGHALHSYYSDKENPYHDAQYVIFVAEVASTVNEVLLMHYLLKHAKTEEEKKSLLSEFIDKFKSTLYRQTMFAEFELLIHDQVEKGKPLTVTELNDIYFDLNKAYFGEDVVLDPQIALEWARIPHFYRSFYVYQYATGFAAAIAIAERILTEGQPAVDQYMSFLKSGGTDFPIELLKLAGVDMSTPEPVTHALQVFADLVAQLESSF